MCFLAHKNNRLVNVYFEHGVSSPYYLQDQEKKVDTDNTGVDVAEEEGVMVTPNDKTRNPSNQSPQNKPTPVNTIDIPNPPINPMPPTNPIPLIKPEYLMNPKPLSQEKLFVNPNDQSQAKSPTNQKPKPPTNPKPKPPISQKPKPPTNLKPKPPTKPILPKNIRFKHAPAAVFAIEDDAFIEKVSNGDVDLYFMGGTRNDAYNAYDPGTDSDEANSWHSKEVKTPPNSEDEGTDEESEDVCPVFREGIRFGELQLEVGMKFNTK
ncbi:uncharacterized protein LOC130962404 [Arachis stenosperma]|uniref:uncharacterized protein LOC130962404 n=1 Tax=Arachis stenosperma TaxID=217475 RepID=UPI0025ABE650|nr:uncharacterized protein LOC130962404 [Arachis stenosperma]